MRCGRPPRSASIFRFGELAAVSAASDDELLDALDEASAAQLVRATSDGARGASGTDDIFAFTHDKIREVLYEELNPIRRRRLHQRIGETLETLHGQRGRRLQRRPTSARRISPIISRSPGILRSRWPTRAAQRATRSGCSRMTKR